MSLRKKWWCAAVALVLSWGVVSSAQASYQVFDLGGDAGWRATTDRALGNQWGLGNFNPQQGYAAWTPYGNPATTTLNSAHMMWGCGVNGAECRNSQGRITGGDGPTEVFFARSFTIKPGAHLVGAALNIIADDFFELLINGHTVAFALLDQHKNQNLEPQPIELDSADFAPYLRTGNNVLAIRAMDGYLKPVGSACDPNYVAVGSHLGDFCSGDRGYEYMYVVGSVQVVPEPSSGGLLGLAGMVALTGQLASRRRRMR